MEEMKNLYLREFSYFNGEHNVVMNIVDICTLKSEIFIAINDQGKITVKKFGLKIKNGNLYFEYGIMNEQLAVNDFEKVEE